MNLHIPKTPYEHNTQNNYVTWIGIAWAPSWSHCQQFLSRLKSCRG